MIVKDEDDCDKCVPNPDYVLPPRVVIKREDKIVEEGMTWWDAHNACHEWGGELASINNEAEWTAVRNLVGDIHAWVGGHDFTHEGRFEWMDGSNFDFTAWHQGEPNDWGHNGEDCLRVQGNGWNDMPCDSKNPFVCKKVTVEERECPAIKCAPNAMVVKGEDGECDKCVINRNWVVNINIIYTWERTIRTTGMNWFDAQATCHEWGGELASINDNAEWEAV